MNAYDTTKDIARIMKENGRENLLKNIVIDTRIDTNIEPVCFCTINNIKCALDEAAHEELNKLTGFKVPNYTIL